MSPEYVRPYAKAQKNDGRDVEAITEVAPRPTTRFVELKSETQLDMGSLHRARDRLLGERTTLINELKAFLLDAASLCPRGDSCWSCTAQRITTKAPACSAKICLSSVATRNRDG